MKKILTTVLSLLILGISEFTFGERVETEIVKFSNGFKVGNVDTNVYTNMSSLYIVYSHTNLTTNMSYAGQSSSNAIFRTPYQGANLSWGKVYSTSTNVFNRTMTMTFYANSDYRGSNAYWRANLSLITVPLTNSTPEGTNTAFLMDATGFSTNDLVWFSVSNEFARVASVSNNVLTFENNLLYPHSGTPSGTTGSISRVAEFGGFAMIDYTDTSNIWFKLATSVIFTQAIAVDLSIRR